MTEHPLETWHRLVRTQDPSGLPALREIVGASDAMLGFETEVDGILVNGVDLVKWNGAGQIVEFKVMLRPLKAINVIQQRMAALLQSGQ